MFHRITHTKKKKEKKISTLDLDSNHNALYEKRCIVQTDG